MIEDRAERVIRDGAVWLRGRLSETEIDQLRSLTSDGDVGKRVSLNEANAAPLLSALTKEFPTYRAVRLVAFAKTGTQGWTLPWHQDRVIAVKDRAAAEGFSTWSQKSGVWHCEPPISSLERMVFLRVFLDDVGPESGGMSYAIGSHKEGKVAQSDAANTAKDYSIETEQADAGDILALPMLTLHRSEKPSIRSPRRVLRVDLAHCALPPPLEWAA